MTEHRESLPVPKRFLRKSILHRRQQLSAEERETLSLCLQQRFLATDEYGDARFLALYSPVRNEVMTQEVFRKARSEGKRVAYPRLAGRKAIEFAEILSLEELRSATFGIAEPAGGQTVSLALLDLIIVPGVAFDLGGFRLGYGHGYYDRLSNSGGFRGRLVGFGFELQMVDVLPVEDHDLRLDALVTEQRVLRFIRDQRTGFAPPKTQETRGGPEH